MVPSEDAVHWRIDSIHFYGIIEPISGQTLWQIAFVQKLITTSEPVQRVVEIDIDHDRPRGALAQITLQSRCTPMAEVPIAGFFTAYLTDPYYHSDLMSLLGISSGDGPHVGFLPMSTESRNEFYLGLVDYFARYDCMEEEDRGIIHRMVGALNSYM